MSSIMFQGVSSGAGKSTLAAIMCRHLSLGGTRVAPFKSLNLSLNSFVTSDGKEIGMAQAFQAMAAGVEPRAEMNPILLKPSGDGVMQLVLEGRPYANVGRGCAEVPLEFLMEAIAKCYSRLGEEFDGVVLEGSGSPAEINLADRDVANMRTAEMAKAPVILVGDIDRGGVFAALYGTYHLLEDRHREMVKGFVINRFRGDPSILGPGVEEMERRMRAPCLGVVPMFQARLPQEDSLFLRSGGSAGMKEGDVRRAWISSLDKAMVEVRGSLDLDSLTRIMEEGLSASRPRPP